VPDNEPAEAGGDEGTSWYNARGKVIKIIDPHLWQMV